MNAAFGAEEKLKQLDKTLSAKFGKARVSILSSFYSFLFDLEENIIEAYAPEYINLFIASLERYTPFFQPLTESDRLTNVLLRLMQIPTIEKHRLKLEEILLRIENEKRMLHSILQGNQILPLDRNRIEIPLIEKEEGSSFATIECLKIKISKNRLRDSFVFVPSGKEIELNLLEQAKSSFNYAKNFVGAYFKRLSPYHEILIYFDNLNASYEGNSLGIALTIGMIEQISLLYNLPRVTHIALNTVSTGGMTRSGEILSVSDDIIKTKLRGVFFSASRIFIIPEADTKAVEEEFLVLKKAYPLRDLTIIGVKHFNDILNRRDLVHYKKQPFILRTAKGAINHRRLLLLSLLFLSIIIFFLLKDIDGNPSTIDRQNQTMIVKNKVGKTLWTHNIAYNIYTASIPHQTYHILADINQDGFNEVILASENLPDSSLKNKGRIVCFDKNKKQIWSYFFSETASTKYEKLAPYYNSSLIGLVEENNKKIILCLANNFDSFGGAIFKLDASTGKRIGNILWNPGHISNGFIRKKEDNSFEIVATCYNNSFERVGAFSVDYGNLFGTTPYASEKYHITGEPIAQLNQYILVPNSDYNKYLKYRNPSLIFLDLHWDLRSNRIKFSTCEGESIQTLAIGYNFTYDFSNVDIVIMGLLRTRRDSLVAHGSLKPPFTDTKEYKDYIKSGILYWDGNKFTNKYLKDNSRF